MRRIGLLSDTHGFLDEAIFDHFSECDEIWHAGDIGSLDIVDQLEEFKPCRMVYGNIDGGEYRSFIPHDQRFEMEGFKVWMTHIGGYPGHYSRGIKESIREEKVGIFICGHSHICRVMYDKSLECLTLNPGACGHHGFHKVRTVLRFTLEEKQIRDMQVIELGRRGQK